MLVQEEFVNATKGWRWGDSGLYEPYTDNIKRLFLGYMREYGRCVSKVYIDINGQSRPIGWVFQKREKYTDCNETYLQETWVTLHDEQPTETTQYHYHFLQ